MNDGQEKPIICHYPNCGIRLERAIGKPPLCFDHRREYFDAKNRLASEGNEDAIRDLRRASGLDDECE